MEKPGEGQLAAVSRLQADPGSDLAMQAGWLQLTDPQRPAWFLPPTPPQVNFPQVWSGRCQGKDCECSGGMVCWWWGGVGGAFVLSSTGGLPSYIRQWV